MNGVTPFAGAKVADLADRDYFDFVLASAEAASRRIWVSMFIFDIRPSRDPEGQALELATTLVARHGAGVDVRVLLTGLVRTPDIAVANLATGFFLAEHGVPHRRMFIEERTDAAAIPERFGSHAKFAVFDDIGVLGSQNWTDDAFRLNIEDGAVLQGPVVDVLAGEFLRLWREARGLPKDAP